ncbi:hypothetical protein AYL99_12041 [Fonsecaea erecta]|uniref:RING-type domain-containing protein n=1 Tax=Fonsecaea erecta TaxID=1367422 RepID=A0A178Z229_9EURO|nr:hypothetical protein AYL99_12041 [Fonsecaea erecta]OAP53757.1 hypothetical protein AYL99_12041 [Fonsecaea erecta]
MPEARYDFDADSLLHEDDCNIFDAYENVVESALDMRRKFVMIVDQARQLKRELLAKQAEIDRLNTRDRQELSQYQHSNKDLQKIIQAQSKRLQQNRETIKMLHRRITQSTKDLEAEQMKLDQVDFLRCEICKENIMNVFTGCGHGFCKGCLDDWLHRPAASYSARDEKSCPKCRRLVRESEIRDVYLGSGTTTPSARDGDGITEVLSSDSDE